MNEKIKKPRGTMDVMPEDVGAWRFVEEKAREAAALYGFREIRTPVFEELGLFRRGVGEVTDVVQKEMYTFADREGREFALRPEGTAGVVRALIENGRTSDVMPQKYYYLIGCYRYEKPQAGRSREFFQFGAECFGAADASADFTMIALADSFIRSLGIKGASLRINSIGCPECRPAYRASLVEYFAAHESALCDTCRERLRTNPLRILDCKSPECSKIAKDAPRAVDHLCGECGAHLKTLTAALDGAGIEYTLDPNIVRGLDYYTRTVFEFVSDLIGAQSTILGGGRYDNLVAELGGPALPGIGFAAGITRLLLAMQASGTVIPEEEKPELYCAPLGDAARGAALAIAEKCRAAGIYAECDIVGRSLKAQMKYADKIGARRVLIIGDDELQKGVAVMKDMKTSGQTEVALADVPSLIAAAVK